MRGPAATRATASVEQSVAQSVAQSVVVEQVTTAQTTVVSAEAIEPREVEDAVAVKADVVKPKLVARLLQAPERREVKAVTQAVTETRSQAPAPVVYVVQEKEAVREPEAPAPQVLVPQVLAPAAPTSEQAGVRVFFGAGINYIQYNENLTEVNTSYRDLRGPTFNAGAEFDITDRVGVAAAYRTTPIQFENSSVNRQTLSSNWSITNLMVQAKSRPFWENSEVTYELGVQVHKLPFALFQYLTRQPELKDVTMVNASFGAAVKHNVNKKTRLVGNGHIQFPVSSAASDSAAKFSLDQKFLFDGSVGVEKQIQKDLWLGLHWYGQYHSVDFTYRDSLINTGGTQSIIFSDIEIRLLKEF